MAEPAVTADTQRRVSGIDTDGYTFELTSLIQFCFFISLPAGKIVKTKGSGK